MPGVFTPGTSFCVKYMFSQVLFGVKWRSVLSYLTGGSLREKALDDRREWRNVLQHLTAREVTWPSSGVAECFTTFDCARSHL